MPHRNTGVFLNASVHRMPSDEKMNQPYAPYPPYFFDSYKRIWMGEYVPCDGPTGKPLESRVDDVVSAYQGTPNGFPPPDIGSWEALGIDQYLCFTRYTRLGPYGFRDDHGGPRRKQDLSKVSWGVLQNRCLTKNKSRFESAVIPDTRTGIGAPDYDDRSMKHTQRKRQEATEEEEGEEEDAGEEEEEPEREGESDIEERAAVAAQAAQQAQQNAERAHSHNVNPPKPYKARSAVLIRTWDTYEYTENDLEAIRSLVSELSLQSGAEYSTFLFVNVKDENTPIFSDDAAYDQALKKYVPAEFREMAILWTEEVCREWYPKIGEWSVYWQQFMPLQWFSRTHPEFDYVWNWEMDARYIGQHYHFTESITNFAKQQPRKFLWERNARYYIPALHGNWKNFTTISNTLIQSAKPSLHTVWGKEPWSEEQLEHLQGPDPPVSEDQDSFSWGVGEEADFITLLPIWDPRETWWSYRDKLFNYPNADQSTEERPFPHIPRRVFINTLVRFSAKLLTAMHYENTAGLAMASEMWPATIALQHGYKAVYAPHPIWQSHHWPPEYMDQTFNADGWGAGSMPGHNIDNGRGVAWNRERTINGEPQTGTGPNGEGRAARWGQERDSPYNPDREHYFAGWSWYFWSDFPRIIYSRWMGWKAGFSIVTIGGRKATDELGLAGGPDVSILHVLLSRE